MMRKKMTIFFLFAGLIVSSCKKDRTCTCTITAISSTKNGVPQSNTTLARTQVVKFSEVTKKGAACTSGEQTTTNSATNNGTVQVTVNVDKFDCKLD
jgi:hypothetical protein